MKLSLIDGAIPNHGNEHNWGMIIILLSERDTTWQGKDLTSSCAKWSTLFSLILHYFKSLHDLWLKSNISGVIWTQFTDHTFGFNADQISYGNLPQGSPVIEDSVLQVPFAIIDEIADDSPAAEDGLQLGDEIVKFGNVQMGDDLQSRLVAEAQSNHGNPIHMEIVRQGVVMHATVTPRTWRGRGLLG